MDGVKLILCKNPPNAQFGFAHPDAYPTMTHSLAFHTQSASPVSIRLDSAHTDTGIENRTGSQREVD